VPVTVLIIFLLLYLNFRRLGFNLSVAVAVGFIALAGVAAETGVVMLIYLEHAYVELQEQRAVEGRPFTREDLYAAIMSHHRLSEYCIGGSARGLDPLVFDAGNKAID
jgi:copper/silver efflux system protein